MAVALIALANLVVWVWVLMSVFSLFDVDDIIRFLAFFNFHASSVLAGTHMGPCIRAKSLQPMKRDGFLIAAGIWCYVLAIAA